MKTVSLKKIIRQEMPFFVGVSPFVWQALFFFIPLAIILILAFIKLSSGAFEGFTLCNFQHFFNWTYVSIILKSLALAVINTGLCCLIGYPIAYFISFHGGRLKNFFLFLLILPFWTNFLLHIYAWFFVLERGGFLNTVLLWVGLIKSPLSLLHSTWVVIMVMVYCYLPFMVLPMYSILESFDRKLIEASADLGATTGQTLRKIILPLSFSGIQTGVLLVFIPSFAEFVIPGLIGGDKYMFVGTVISQYILGNRTLALGAAFTVISCTALILATLFVIMALRTFLVGRAHGK